MSVISKKSKVPPAINLLLQSLVKVTRKKTKQNKKQINKIIEIKHGTFKYMYKFMCN